MPVGSVRDMLIEYNFGQASRKRHDAPHPDFIQYTLNNVRGRWNIGTIRWNAYLRGEGPEDVVDASGFFIQATPSSSTARLHGRVYGNLYCGGTADGFALDFAEPDLMFENNVILRALSGPNARVPSPCRFPNAYGGVARRNVTNAGFDLSEYNLSETLFNKLLGLSPAEYAEAFVNPQWDTNFASLAEAMQAWAPVEGGPLQNDDGSYSGWMFPADSDGTARINTGRPWVKDRPDRSPGS